MAVLLVRGFGQGMVTVPLTSAAYVGLSGPQIADVSIIGRTAQQLGGSFGTAVLAVILQANLGNQGASASVANALDTSFWWAVAFTAAAVVLALILPGRPEPATPAAGAADADLTEAQAELEAAGLDDDARAIGDAQHQQAEDRTVSPASPR
ncbi:hypothetical protein ABZS66_16705 [Dactylosporangium sp. NPDC005572]|uniref:hypothetical protein n=1 Tax=Dactylosporangium sp. NPDC005572 TaxID=3156889 RepID=UPI0033BABDB8